MRDRSGETITKESNINTEMESIVHNNTGLDGAHAFLFHLEMWTYVHGIATMLAMGFLNLDRELASKMLTDSYQGLKKQCGME